MDSCRKVYMIIYACLYSDLGILIQSPGSYVKPQIWATALEGRLNLWGFLGIPNNL